MGNNMTTIANISIRATPITVTLISWMYEERVY